MTCGHCEIFCYCRKWNEINPLTPAGISHCEAIFHARSAVHKSRRDLFRWKSTPKGAFSGPSGETRTRGILVPNQAPYQLGHTRIFTSGLLYTTQIKNAIKNMRVSKIKTPWIFNTLSFYDKIPRQNFRLYGIFFSFCLIFCLYRGIIQGCDIKDNYADFWSAGGILWLEKLPGVTAPF